MEQLLDRVGRQVGSRLVERHVDGHPCSAARLTVEMVEHEVARDDSGVGLGIVLTVNDPTGINAVPEDDRGQGSGIISTSEQFGGAVGIAVFMMLFLTYYFHEFYAKLTALGIDVTDDETTRAKDYVLEAEQSGREHVRPPRFFGDVLDEFESAYVSGYGFVVMGVVAIVGAVVSFLLVRRRRPAPDAR
jgi:hypothetical protein